MTKAKILRILIEYFNSKKEVLGLSDYRAQDDAPIKSAIVLRLWGSWARVALAANRCVNKDVKQFKLVRN